MTPVISIRGLSKAYTIFENPRSAMLEAVFGGVRHDLFWALKDVSFDVFERQRIGIIGANGAGKSTLLKLITGNLTPTSGSLVVNGAVSAMLSLTSFLNPDQTGLENIRFNLTISGVPASEQASLTEEIIDFTELGAFIHAPVRTYSSGMHARLAFGISTSITPDILVVDEILSAGDAYFAAKATYRMLELCRSGRALLFVSHSMSAVQMLCDTAVWLDNGAVREIGPVHEVGRSYEAHFRAQEDEVLRQGNQARRTRLANQVLPEEVERPGIARLRLAGPTGRVVDTHYVRRLTLDLDGQTIDVPLEFRDIDDPGVVACLDTIHSEWGRPHDRKGSAARALAQGSSALRGGNVLIRPPVLDVSVPLTVTVESTSLRGVEQLRAQAMNVAAGRWIDLEEVERKKLGEGWLRQSYQGTIEATTVSERRVYVDQIIEEGRPDVEIVEVAMVVDGRDAVAVRERQPFTLEVRVRANRPADSVDAIIKLTRVDGVPVFWQTSAQNGVVAELPGGEAVFSFDFDPNLLGGADYMVTVELGNGFDIETNWPHSEIFDRRVNALKFTVTREWAAMNFGPVNYVYPVRLESA